MNPTLIRLTIITSVKVVNDLFVKAAVINRHDIIIAIFNPG